MGKIDVVTEWRRAIPPAAGEANLPHSRRSATSDGLKTRLAELVLAVLPLTVLVTGALALDRIGMPGGDTGRSTITTRPSLDRLASLRDAPSLLDVVPSIALASPTHRIATSAETVLAQTAMTRLPIGLEARDGVPAGSYLIVRGVPGGATLSHGFEIGPEIWLVDAMDVDRLNLRLRAVGLARFTVGLQWVTVEGRLLAQDNLLIEARPPPELEVPLATMPALKISTPAIELPRADDEPTQPRIGPKILSKGEAKGRSRPQLAVDPAIAAATAKAATSSVREIGRVAATGQIDGKLVETALARGRRMLELGNFAAGRPLLERAAHGGSATAAMLIASTYDPSWLRGNGAVGITPDADKARRWYDEARRLGAIDAIR